MKSGGLKRAALLAAIAFLAALAGVLIGRGLADRKPEQPAALHDLLHRQLGLDARQEAAIEDLEASFAVKRRQFELELKSDNARLAAALAAAPGFGPRGAAEVERSHRTMGELQKETLAHIFAMRAVLRPDQAKKFDRAVVKALTTDAE